MKVKVLWLCEENEAGHYEQLMIKQFGTLAPHGYNCTTGGEINKRFSDETKQKISSALRVCSKERCKRIIDSYLSGSLRKDIVIEEGLSKTTIQNIVTMQNGYSWLKREFDEDIIKKLNMKIKDMFHPKVIEIPNEPGEKSLVMKKISERWKSRKCTLRKKMRNNKKIHKKSVDHIRNLEKILLEHGIKLPKRSSEDIYNYPLIA